MKIQKLEEVRKNVHQTHLEDLVLLGKEGFDELYNHIDNFINKLENKEAYGRAVRQGLSG